MRALAIACLALFGCTNTGLPFEEPGFPIGDGGTDVGHVRATPDMDALKGVPRQIGEPTPDAGMAPIGKRDGGACGDPGDGGAPLNLLPEKSYLALGATASSLLLMWADRGPYHGADRFLGRSVDRGESFLAAIDLGGAADGTTYQQSSCDTVALATDGRSGVATACQGASQIGGSNTEGWIRVQASTDDGQHFSAGGFLVWSSCNVSSCDAWLPVQPAVALAPGNSVAVAWEQVDGDTQSVYRTEPSTSRHVLLAVSTDFGNSYGAPLEATDEPLAFTAGDSAPSVAVGPDGNILVTWIWVDSDVWGSPNNRVMGQLFDKSGNKVGGNVVISGAGDSPVDYSTAPVAADPVMPGVYYVAFPSGSPDGRWDIHVAATFDGGNTFQPSVKVNEDTTCAAHVMPAIGVDRRERVHTAWLGNPSGEWDVFYGVSPPADSNDPLAFGRSSRLTQRSFADDRIANPLYPHLGPWVVAAGDLVYVAYLDPDTYAIGLAVLNVP